MTTCTERVLPCVPAVPAHSRRTRGGIGFAVAAYLWWGLIPAYYKLLTHVPATELLAHRIVWSGVLLVPFLLWRGRIGEVLRVIRGRREALYLLGSTLLIAFNWLIFIWAVNEGLVLQASLGYFINPVFSVLLGRVFLHERLRSWQIVSLFLAATGVAWLTVSYGSFPAVALALAISFGLYGLLRKKAGVGAVVGLTIEILMLTPIALGYLVLLAGQGHVSFMSAGWRTSALLAAAGVVTTLPLIWYAEAALRLRLSTLGFLQYMAPTCQFALAVIAFGEVFTRDHAVCFAFVWAGVAVFLVDLLRASRPRPVAGQAAA